MGGKRIKKTKNKSKARTTPAPPPPNVSYDGTRTVLRRCKCLFSLDLSVFWLLQYRREQPLGGGGIVVWSKVEMHLVGGGVMVEQ